MKKNTVSNPEQKINQLIDRYIAWAIDACGFSRHDLMKGLLEIFTPAELESLGRGDTMRSFLAADDSWEDSDK